MFSAGGATVVRAAAVIGLVSLLVVAVSARRHPADEDRVGGDSAAAESGR
ncbi:MAG TPA: hypothetical protein VFV66_04320 [Nonomuraea sp.]|nr:hypothetical protein [Nonomuraea sp.]